MKKPNVNDVAKGFSIAGILIGAVGSVLSTLYEDKKSKTAKKQDEKASDDPK